MNFIKRLFKKKIFYTELKALLKELGQSDKFIKRLDEHQREGYSHYAYGKLDVCKKPDNKIIFDLDIQEGHVRREYDGFVHGYLTEKHNLKKEFSYEEIEKSQILKKYIKPSKLEKSLSIISIIFVLVGLFFISNNLTGNVVLPNIISNNSFFLGGGFFVLGILSFVLAKTI